LGELKMKQRKAQIIKKKNQASNNNQLPCPKKLKRGKRRLKKLHCREVH